MDRILIESMSSPSSLKQEKIVASDSLTFAELSEAVRTGAAFRSRVELQPAGGEGTKVFPPTYAGSQYALEKRRVPNSDKPVDCVLLDSVQSQANRMEEALQQAIDSGRFKAIDLSIPLIEVDFTGFFPPREDLAADLRLLDPVGKISSLQAPHRIADAILRDSVVEEDGKPFRSKSEEKESEYGKRLRRVSLKNATPLFGLCPTALLFGMWDSTGPKGGLGAKFERALVSEIVGIDATEGVRTSSRLDPLGIQLNAGPLFEAKDDSDVSWTLNAEQAKKKDSKPIKIKGDGKPSEANHGNIKPDLRDKNGKSFHGGVTIARAEQSIVLSLPALRRLHFPVKDHTSPEADLAALTVLAALGLTAAILAAESGLDLRSRCLLWPTGPLAWELLGKAGTKPKPFQLDSTAAIELLKQAVQAATKAKLPWREKPLVLTPSIDLVRLVVKSQQLAVQGGEGDQ